MAICMKCPSPASRSPGTEPLDGEHGAQALQPTLHLIYPLAKEKAVSIYAVLLAIGLDGLELVFHSCLHR